MILLRFGLKLFGLLVGEPKNHHFYDLGILGRVPEPQNYVFFFWDVSPNLKTLKSRNQETQKLQNQETKNEETKKPIFFYFRVRESPAPLNK